LGVYKQLWELGLNPKGFTDFSFPPQGFGGNEELDEGNSLELPFLLQSISYLAQKRGLWVFKISQRRGVGSLKKGLNPPEFFAPLSQGCDTHCLGLRDFSHSFFCGSQQHLGKQNFSGGYNNFSPF